VTTIHNSHGTSIRPSIPTEGLLDLPHLAAVEDPVETMVREALQGLLSQLKVTPSYMPLNVQALHHETFSVAPPASGFTITVPNPLPSPAPPITLQATPDVEWALLNSTGQQVNPGNGFTASPSTLDTLAIQLLFFPQIVKDRAGVADSSSFTLQASIRLTAAHPVTGEPVTEPKDGRFRLPAVPVRVPAALRIPPILALFRHKSFTALQGTKKGFAIVFAPPQSGIREIQDLTVDGKLGDLLCEVGVLRSAIESLPVAEQSLLSGFAGNLEGFLDGLSSLVTNLAAFDPLPDAASAKPPLALQLHDHDENLNTETLIPGFFKDIERENEVSSLIFIGFEESVRLYNRRKFKTGQGILRVKTGAQMCAVIDRLDRATPRATIGDASISTPEPANFALRADTFENALASFHFGDDPPN